MGGRGGSSMTTARNVANALGIARQDVQRMMAQQKIEPPPNYPKVKREPIPLEMSTDMIYVSRLKMELDQRLRDSQFFVEAEKEDKIRRYLDKYSIIEREKLEADMECLPDELSWKKKSKNSKGDPKAKKRKLAADDTIIDEKLRKLEEKEGNDENENNDNEENTKKAADDDSGSEKSAAEDGENQLSDDDYQEEDNDYISNYFDNGEGYGDAGSDDNMDGDEY